MKIKNNVLKSGVILMMGATLGSCSDFLELEPLNEIVLERFWNEESDIENIVAGCYSALQSGQVIDRMMAWGEYRSDNIIGGTNVQSNASLVNIFKENLNASNGYTTWDAFYDIINRCNTVIYYAPSVADRDPNYTQSELQATIAEVSAIRDLCYFYLIRTFRDVPYSTEAFQDDTQRMDLPATPFNAVLDSLILDLERVEPFAVRKYPETKPLYQFGRITQDAIHAMLCDMYLWKQDYQNSVKYADMLIEAKLKEYDYRQMNALGSSSVEKLIDGFPLISDAPTSGNEYGQAYEAIFGKGTSTESIFELIFTNDRSMPSNGSISGAYGNETTFPGVVKAADFMGLRQNHYLSVTGGGEKARFRIAGGYDHETGSVIKQKLDRFSTRVALDYYVSDRITITTNFAMTFTNNKRNSDGLLSIAYRKMPNMGIYEQDPLTGKDTDKYYMMLRQGPSAGSSVFDGDQKGLVNPVASAFLAKYEDKTYDINPEFELNYRLLGMDDQHTQLNWQGRVYMNIWNQYR